jgi:Flp pilus assembly protein TadD
LDEARARRATFIPPWAGKATRLVPAGLALLAVELYARTWSFPFLSMDDYAYVAGNPRVALGLTWENLAWAFSTTDHGLWHPLTWLSLMLDVSVFGSRPGPIHLVNVGLHAANGVLLFLALRRLTGSTGRSAFVAALFAVHPMHVESVAWIAERKDVLSTFFALLALLAYDRYVRRPDLPRLGVVVGLFGASLLAKPMLVTLPFVLLLLDVYPLGRAPVRWRTLRMPSRVDIRAVGWPRAVAEKLPMILLSLAVSGVGMAAAAGGVEPYPAGLRAANALVSYVRYVEKLLFPVQLSALYPFPQSGVPGWQVALAIGILSAITAGAMALSRRAPWVAVGWLWFLGTLVPAIGIVQVGPQAMADRFSYFPSIGLFAAAVWGAAELSWSRAGRFAAPATAVAILVLLSIATVRQVDVWSDDEVLFRHALSASGPSWRVHHQLGKLAHVRGRDAEARDHLLESVRIHPDAANLTDLGTLAMLLGRPAEAEDAFRRALSLDPFQDEAALALAGLLERSGRLADVAQILGRAARGRPGRTTYRLERRVALGAALVDLGRIDDGIAVIEEALSRDPRNPEVLSSLSEAYFHRGDAPRAERLAIEAVKGGARSGGAYLVLGAVRLARGDAGGAVDVLGHAVQLEPDEPFRRLPLADGLARMGRKKDACEQWTFVHASPLATSSDRDRAERGARDAACPPPAVP